MGTLLIFFCAVIIIALIILWVFGCLGLMNLAKANNVKNPWLVFIPYGGNYLLGKLGFEIYPDGEEKNPTLTWVLLGLSIASGVFSSSETLASLILVAVYVFTTIAYSKIYKYMIPEQAAKYTVLSFFFGGLPLYFNKSIIKPKNEVDTNTNVKTESNISEADVVSETRNNESVQEPEIKKSNFCPNCGSKLGDGIKFCPNCGNKID